MSTASVRYELTAPLIITSRLLPGLRLGEATVSLTADHITHDETGQRLCWRYWIDDPAGLSYEAADLYRPYAAGAREPDTADVRDALGALLSFLTGAAEAYRAAGYGPEPADGWLFSAEVDAWAHLYDEEITVAGLDMVEAGRE